MDSVSRRLGCPLLQVLRRRRVRPGYATAAQAIATVGLQPTSGHCMRGEGGYRLLCLLNSPKRPRLCKYDKRRLGKTLCQDNWVST